MTDTDTHRLAMPMTSDSQIPPAGHLEHSLKAKTQRISELETEVDHLLAAIADISAPRARSDDLDRASTYSPSKPANDAEVARLRRELKQVTEDRDLLAQRLEALRSSQLGKLQVWYWKKIHR